MSGRGSGEEVRRKLEMGVKGRGEEGEGAPACRASEGVKGADMLLLISCWLAAGDDSLRAVD